MTLSSISKDLKDKYRHLGMFVGLVKIVSPRDVAAASSTEETDECQMPNTTIFH